MLIDLIYPPVCGICDRICKKHLCKECEIDLKKYEINEIENAKGDESKYYDYQVKTFKYKGKVRSKIIDYKFNEKSYMCHTFQRMITKNEKIYSFLKKYDIILYVPMFKKQEYKRGYNQTYLIAKEIGKTLGIPIEKNNLTKIKDTKKQSTLTKEERKTNVKDAFVIRKPERIVNKKVILFDDIFTTGNTVNECSKVIKMAGAKEVAILTIAVD